MQSQILCHRKGIHIELEFDEIVAVDDCSWMSFCFLQVLSSAVQVVVGVENAFQIRGRLMTDFPA